MQGGMFGRATAYLDAVPGKAEGQDEGRDSHAFRTACFVVEKFQLARDDIEALMMAWDARANQPPLGAQVIRQKVASAWHKTSYSQEESAERDREFATTGRANGNGNGNGISQAGDALAAQAAAFANSHRLPVEEEPPFPCYPLPDEALWAKYQRNLHADHPRSKEARDWLVGFGLTPDGTGWGLAALTASQLPLVKLGRYAAGPHLLVPVRGEDGQLITIRRYYAPWRTAEQTEQSAPKIVGWCKGDRRRAYGLDRLGDAATIWVVEGEKDTEVARAIGLAALTCTTGAASLGPMVADLPDDLLAGRRVNVLCDNDSAGAKAASAVASHLAGRGVPGVVCSWPADRPERHDLADELAAAIAEHGPDAGPGKVAALVAQLEEVGVSLDVAAAEQARANDAERTRRSAERMARRNGSAPLDLEDGPQAGGAAAQDGRPVVQVGEVDQTVVLAEFQAAVAAQPQPRLFRREGNVVRVVSDERGGTAIDLVGIDTLRSYLGTITQCVRPTQKGGTRSVTCPPDLASFLLCAGHDGWPLPRLTGIASVPLLRPDGTLCTTPGYDAETGIMYRPSPGMVVPPVPDRPTAAQVAEAKAALDHVVSGFPFIDQASHDNLVYLCTMAVLRPTLPGLVMMALISAPQQGSGKSEASKLPGLLGAGDTSFMAMPKAEDEWQKQLLAIIRSGRPVRVLDNVRGQINSDTFAGAFTSPRFETRVLGTNQLDGGEMRVVWAANGNNLTIGGDWNRRAYSIGLDAQTSRPFVDRQFAIPDLSGYVLANRGRLVGAVLTMARHWYAEGQPKPPGSRIVAGFDAACVMGGGILGSAGYEHVLANLTDTWDNADDEGATWESFLRAWAGCFTRPVAVKVVADTVDFALNKRDPLLAIGGDNPFADEHDRATQELAQCLPDDLLDTRGLVNRKRLGRALKERENRRYGSENWHLRLAGKDGRTCRPLFEVRHG